MRIAHVITGLGVGGAERVLLDLCGELARAGHTVAIWSLTGDLGAVERGVDDRVRIETLAVTRNPLTWLVGCFRFVTRVHAFRADVVHAHLFHALPLAIVAGMAGHRPPIVFTSHSYSVRSRVRRWILRATKSYRSADVTFGTDQHPELNSEKVAVIPNGIPLPVRGVAHVPFAAGARAWRLINVGRFAEPKAHLTLLAQFAQVIDRGVDAELWLVGDGPLRGEIEAAAKRLGIASQVKLLGRRTDVQDLLAASDVFVLSSKWEGLPIALLEAGLAELPVISTPVGRVPQLLSDGCGKLADADDLGRAMCDTLACYEVALDMGRRLGARIRADYSVRAMTEAHIRLYSSLLLANQGVAE